LIYYYIQPDKSRFFIDVSASLMSHLLSIAVSVVRNNYSNKLKAARAALEAPIIIEAAVWDVFTF
jgi:hypothetical protein